MGRPNFGFKGSGLTTTDAIAAGATVTTGNYVYLSQLSAVTPSTNYPPMAPDPGGGGTPVITITQQPTQVTAVNGSGTFSVAATTTSGTLTYQWQRGQIGSSTFTNITGATSASYARTQLVPYDNYLAFYRCVVSCDGATSVISDAAGWSNTSTWYGYFNTPDTAFTALFGTLSATSGSAASKLSATFAGFGGPVNCYTTNTGTLRITGTLTGDDAMRVTVNGADYYGPGGSNGYSNEAVSITVSSVFFGSAVSISGSYLKGPIQMWLVPNA